MPLGMTIVLNTSLSGFLGSSQNSESEPGQDVPASEMSFTKLMETITHGEDSTGPQPETSKTLDLDGNPHTSLPLVDISVAIEDSETVQTAFAAPQDPPGTRPTIDILPRSAAPTRNTIENNNVAISSPEEPIVRTEGVITPLTSGTLPTGSISNRVLIDDDLAYQTLTSAPRDNSSNTTQSQALNTSVANTQTQDIVSSTITLNEIEPDAKLTRASSETLISEPKSSGIGAIETAISRITTTEFEQSIDETRPSRNTFIPNIVRDITQNPDFKRVQSTQTVQHSDAKLTQEFEGANPTNTLSSSLETLTVKDTQTHLSTGAKTPTSTPQVQSVGNTPNVETVVFGQTLNVDAEEQLVRVKNDGYTATVQQTSQTIPGDTQNVPHIKLHRDGFSSTELPPQTQDTLETFTTASLRAFNPTILAPESTSLDTLKPHADKIEFKVATPPGLMTADVVKPSVESLPQLFSVNTAPTESLARSAPIANAIPSTFGHSTQPAALQTVGQNLIHAIVNQSSVSVRLDPPEMGNVTINFQFDAERGVTAIVRSELVETSIFLKERAEILQQTLKDSGFDSVDLSFEHGHSASDNPHNPNRHFQHTDSTFGTYDIVEDSSPAGLINYTRNYGVDDQIDLRL